MTTLLGADGQSYEAPDEAAAQKAVASGQFTIAPATPQPPSAEPAPPVTPTVSAVPGGDSAAVSPEVQAAQEEKADHDAIAKVLPPDTSDVPLIGEDGKIYDSPSPEAQQAAIATGKFRLSTLAERNAAEDAGILEKRAENTGPIEAAALGVARHIPGADLAASGIAGAISGKSTRQELAESQQEADAVAEKRPGAYYTGATVGELGGAAIGGEVAGAVTKTAGLSGFAKAAAEGAIYSAEPVAKAIVNKDPAASAEALALGIGLNVALHGAFTGIAKLPGLAADATEGIQEAAKAKFVPEYTREEAENLISQKTGLTPAQIARNRENGVDIGDAFKQAGITVDDFVEGRHIQKLQALDSSGPAIGRAVKELDASAEKAPIIEQSLSDAASEIRAKLLPPEVVEHEAAAASLDAAKAALSTSKIALREAATTTERLAAREAISEAESKIASIGKVKPLSEIAEGASRALQPILDQIESSASKGTFGGQEGTQALKEFVSDQIDRTGAVGSSTANALKKRAEGIVVASINNAEDAVGAKLGSADVVEGLRKQRALYAIDRIFGGAADKVAARAQPEQLGHLLGGPHTGSGHMLPHFVLHALRLPSGINAALAVTGIPQMVKHYVERQNLRGAAAKLLGGSTAPTTNTVVHALQRQQLELSDGVKAFFGSLGTREAAKTLDTSGGIRGFVPDANGISHKQQIASLQRLVTQSQTDPTVTAARLDKVVEPLRAEGLHEVADAYTQHQLRLLKVLQAILPGDPDLVAKAHPFAAKVEESEIEPATKARLQRALTIAADPKALLQLIHTNQITQGDVAIAAAVNPSTLQKLRDEVVREGMKAKPDLTYQQRLSMGILLGQHIDESTEQVPQLQAAYAGAAAPPSAGGGGHKSGKLSAGSSKSLANSSLTLSQGGHSR